MGKDYPKSRTSEKIAEQNDISEKTVRNAETFVKAKRKMVEASHPKENNDVALSTLIKQPEQEISEVPIFTEIQEFERNIYRNYENCKFF